MRTLLLARSFNSLTQRVWVELEEAGHEVSLELDVNDGVTEEAVELWRPDVVVATTLERRLPASVWSRVPCLVVHPGPPGDRGRSALDWAILEGAPRWGVTVLQATEELDGGPVWEARSFAMREATKSSLHRHEVTDAAVDALHAALARLQAGERPRPADEVACDVRGRPRPRCAQADRAIDWSRDPTRIVLRKLRASDGRPGVRDALAGRAFHLFDGHAEPELRGPPGALLARREGAVCRATSDGAVWLGRLRQEGEHGLKLPAAQALGEVAAALPEVPAPDGRGEVAYEEADGVGCLRFRGYNGALSVEQCRRLRRAVVDARARPTRVLVLLGGPDFWCNGIDLVSIEAADSPSDESLRTIEAMDDLARELLTLTDRLTIAALGGNAAAGGAFLALAADLVVARRGVVLNPHYKNMGNLYGSEYWTYTLPRRVGPARVDEVLRARLPVGTAQAERLGLVDVTLAPDPDAFAREVAALARRLARDPALDARLAEKARRRAEDEARKPLEAYRAEELERVKRDFYGFDPSYHVARYDFVFKVPKSRTALHLARHRR